MYVICAIGVCVQVMTWLQITNSVCGGNNELAF